MTDVEHLTINHGEGGTCCAGKCADAGELFERIAQSLAERKGQWIIMDCALLPYHLISGDAQDFRAVIYRTEEALSNGLAALNAERECYWPLQITERVVGNPGLLYHPPGVVNGWFGEGIRDMIRSLYEYRRLHAEPMLIGDVDPFRTSSEPVP